MTTILGIIGTVISILAFVIPWYLRRKSNREGMDRNTIESINASIKQSQNIKSLVNNLSKSERNKLLAPYFRK